MNRDDDGTLPDYYIRSCEGLGPRTEAADRPGGGDPQPYDLALTEPGDDR